MQDTVQNGSFSCKPLVWKKVLSACFVRSGVIWMKIVVGEKSGKSYQVEIPKEKDALLVGKKIGEEFDGGIIGAAGYTLKITGGSDISGFPMRNDVAGSRRASVVLASGTGFRSMNAGERARKTVHGNTVDLSIVQLNTVVVAAGAEPLEKLMPKSEKADKKEEKK